MAANVESMFYTRTAPWHGLGTRVLEAPASKEALVLAGLDWKVLQKSLSTADGLPVPGFKANVRETDNRVLGVVTDRYKVVQNEDAFAFTDSLLGEGVTYETAGSLQDGRRTWILARLPQRYIISGDEMAPYLVFMNSHDGSGVSRTVPVTRNLAESWGTGQEELYKTALFNMQKSFPAQIMAMKRFWDWKRRAMTGFRFMSLQTSRDVWALDVFCIRVF